MDTKDETKTLALLVGRTYRGEGAPPITTPDAVAELHAMQAPFSAKPGAMSIQVYFITKGIDNPILQASMAAYTKVRIATVEDFDEIFEEHHRVPEAKVENPSR
jgi:hypothetical protein